jgi:hypothetical protein
MSGLTTLFSLRGSLDRYYKKVTHCVPVLFKILSFADLEPNGPPGHFYESIKEKDDAIDAKKPRYCISKQSTNTIFSNFFVILDPRGAAVAKLRALKQPHL